MKKRKIILIFFLASIILLTTIGVTTLNEEPEQTQDMPSNDWFGTVDTFTVPAGQYVIREKEFFSSAIKISFEVIKGGSINILVLKESDYWKWKDGQDVQNPFPSSSPTGVSGDMYFSISDGKWFFVWDNTFDLINDKEVRAIVS